jgi:hypothetical protein
MLPFDVRRAGGPAAAVLAAGVALAGCSLSASSLSISDSVSASSESLASSVSSLSPKSATERYSDSVRTYATSWARGGGSDAVTFQARVAELAREQGITDWEGSPLTWRAVGEGLRKAGVRGGEYEALKQAAAGGDPGHMAQIADGYDRAQ